MLLDLWQQIKSYCEDRCFERRGNAPKKIGRGDQNSSIPTIVFSSNGATQRGLHKSLGKKKYPMVKN